MNLILVKVFATALALSQVTTRPDAVRTQLDPVRDQAEVVQILRDGCAHIRKVFDIESINLDDLITTAMDDPQAMSGNIKALHGLKFDELFVSYRQFCRNETVADSPVDVGEVIAYYDKAVADLPDHTRLKGLELTGMSVVLDQKGGRFAELGEPNHRRVWVPLGDVPDFVQKAFVAAEDKRFFQHKGIDERGMIRAFVGNLAQPGRPQGGSTITQQVVKNLLVGDDVTYDRKIREIIVASRLEAALSKQDILALYLNSIYLGRGAFGIELAARSYFGKPARELNLAEGALLAGLTKGPSYFNPDRHPDRIRERVAYVLGRMQEDGVISAAQVKQAQALSARLVAYDRPRRDTGFYFVDQLTREAKSAAGIDALATSSYAVRATVQPALQRATESALQEGLARYEMRTGRARFAGPQANLADAVQHIEDARKSPPVAADADAPEPPPAGHPRMPAWQEALEAARLPLYDVHWPAAVVVAMPTRNSATIRVGLRDGRIVTLRGAGAEIRRTLKLYDVVLVQLAERSAKGKGSAEATAELRVPPTVQGAALVLENKTGRILAMAGGFSYPQSQLNRVTQSRRQPGSALKPLTYLAALEAGLQPNTLVLDEPITLPPINSGNARERDYWSPKDYDNASWGAITLRRALENSKNLVTARLLDGAISSAPEDSLDRVCAIAMEAQLYGECVRYYPFVLGAQPVRMIDLAAFYAGVANEGARPAPYAIESIEQNGKEVYRHPQTAPVSMGPPDPATFYQLKTMLQGVVERGTARGIRQLAPYVAGKTGTTENENDAWFVGFTNDVTVAVWVGYDNADGQRRTLGSGETGGSVAVPIFESIIQSAWSEVAPRVALSPPSAAARRQLVDLPIDLRSGDRVARNGTGAFMEHFRLDRTGQVDDTQYRLVSREDAYATREADQATGEVPQTWSDADPATSYNRNYDSYGNRGVYGQAPMPQWRIAPSPQPAPQVQQPRGWFSGNPFGWGNDDRPRPRRVDPDYPGWGRGLY
ncbi:MAG: transglycosylase domain-containing protein [Xanthobacteraceae bacterium]